LINIHVLLHLETINFLIFLPEPCGNAWRRNGSGVRNKDVLTDLDVILERNVLDFNVLVGPLVEELAGAIGAGSNVSGQIKSSHVR
jgi:hypothetical protein